MRKALFIHGLGAGANSLSGKLLKSALTDYEWICPELTHYCEPSLEILSQALEETMPELIVGTSLGGFYALCVAHKATCPIILTNPVIDAQKDIRQFIGEHHYFCKRLDRQRHFFVIGEDCDAYCPKSFVENQAKAFCDRIWLFYSDHDNILGFDYYQNYLELFGDRCIRTSLMGHTITPEFLEQELKAFIKRTFLP